MSVVNRFFIRKNQRGDTIVEVLISIAVASLILGGAYVTTNNSLRATRAAEERTAALKLIQGQIEFIRSMMTTDAGAAALDAAPSKFCIIANTVAGAQPSTPDAATAACSQSANGAPTTTQPVYKVTITRAGNSFTVMSEWPSIISDGTDNVQLTYRVYQQ